MSPGAEPTTSSSSFSLFSIIESGLELAGKRSKDIILNYIEYKYGLTSDSMAEHKDEFENYIREILGESAEIIISRINQQLLKEESKKENCQCTDGILNDAQSAVSSQVEGTGRQQRILLLKQTQKSSYGVSRARLSYSTDFLVCDNCFWSASFLTSNYELRCMACGHEILSALPIASNESFSVEISPKRGISLSFR